PMTARMNRDLSNPNTSTDQRQEIADEYAKHFPQVPSLWMSNGAYLKLQNVSISWEMPTKVVKSIGGLKGARLKLSGRNLWLLTGYKGIMDPGSTSIRSTDFGANIDYFGSPNPRQVQLTLNVS